MDSQRDRTEDVSDIIDKLREAALPLAAFQHHMLPDFSKIAAPIVAAQRRWAELAHVQPTWMRDLSDVARQFGALATVYKEPEWMHHIQQSARQFEAMRLVWEQPKWLGDIYRAARHVETLRLSMAPALEQAVAIGRTISVSVKRCERLEEAGWLPHYTTPFDAIEEAGDGESINEILERHYTDHWPEVRTAFHERLGQYDLDDEAKAVFAEALEAHGAGHYRCAPRLLFPEIERVARLELHQGSLSPITSQNDLRAEAGNLCPSELEPGGYYGMKLFSKLHDHLYVHAKTPEALAVISVDPVPNRHAVLHGLLPYGSMANSMNAIIMTDYVFQVICAVKRNRVEIAANDTVNADASNVRQPQMSA